jgi:sugar-phosphatase
MCDVEGVLFDLDGVLADSAAAIDRHWVAFASQYGLNPEQILTRAHGRRADELMRELLPAADVPSAYAAFVELEASDCADTVPIKGAAELLEQLSARRWAVVTSGERRVAASRLAAAGLPQPRVFVTAGDVLEGKPSPEGYLQAAAGLGVDTERCVAIEDSPAGLRAARAAGAVVVGCTTTHSPADIDVVAHHRVRDLRDITAASNAEGLWIHCQSCL